MTSPCLSFSPSCLYYLCPPVVLLGDGLVPLLPCRVPGGMEGVGEIIPYPMPQMNPEGGHHGAWPPPSTHQIWMRTLMPSTSIVFILKSTPAWEEGSFIIIIFFLGGGTVPCSLPTFS